VEPDGSTENRALKVIPQGHAKKRGATEESERLIVALTPGESREERRGCSLVGRVSDE